MRVEAGRVAVKQNSQCEPRLLTHAVPGRYLDVAGHMKRLLDLLLAAVVHREQGN